MDVQSLVRQLKHDNGSKIVLYVGDGLGGLPQAPGGKTELETARTPNLDRLAREGVLGLSIPVAPGIAPGSGPGHLGLFGYDPVRYLIGRGALEATGIGFALRDGDIAIRANFCTIDGQGKITDRRAGRIATEESAPLAVRLRAVKIPGVEVFVEPVKEHRFVVVLRPADPSRKDFGGRVADTDPQATGVPPLDPAPQDDASRGTAEACKEFVRQAKALLAGETKANCCTLRGITGRPEIPSFHDIYGLRAAAIAVYPMYKGLASLVGMDILGEAKTLDEQVETLRSAWDDYDFFFVHFKYTDSSGEDGDFALKVRRTEEYDAAVPRILDLKPDVFIATGDHSTPSMLASHSWHPVPTLLWARHCRTDACASFGESECLRGGLGQFEARHLMTLAMANAGRLAKFGA